MGVLCTRDDVKCLGEVFFSTGSTDGASEYCVGALTSAEEKKVVSDRFNQRASIGSTGGHCVSSQKFNGYFVLRVTR